MKLYICGDSFGVPDPEYGACWVDYLAQQTDWEITNQCQTGASNLLISLQVDRAIQEADAIIYLATAATRTEMRIANGTGPLLTQFKYKSLTSVSLRSIDHTTCLSPKQQSLAREYHKNFDDLGLNIYRSKCIIQSTLYRLSQSSVPWLFDQGGFEHPNYSDEKYFEEYNSNRSELCLWDYTQSRKFRPYYHITDPAVHRRVADYYSDFVRKLS